MTQTLIEDENGNEAWLDIPEGWGILEEGSLSLGDRLWHRFTGWVDVDPGIVGVSLDEPIFQGPQGAVAIRQGEGFMFIDGGDTEG